jgi:hypothetical protein
VSVVIRDVQTREKHPTNFRLSARCEELAVQLRYFIEQTRQAAQPLQPAADGGDSWLDSYIQAFCSPDAHRQLCEAQQQAEYRWEALATELEALGQYKQRLATFMLVQRLVQTAPRLRERLSAAELDLADATARIKVMAAAGTRNLETGQLQIPAKYAREYPQQAQRLEKARSQIPRVQRRLKRETAVLSQRLASTQLLGSAVLPALQLLGPISSELAALAPAMADSELRGLLDTVEGLLGATLEMATDQVWEETAAEPAYGADEPVASDDSATVETPAEDFDYPPGESEPTTDAGDTDFPGETHAPVYEHDAAAGDADKDHVDLSGPDSNPQRQD